MALNEIAITFGPQSKTFGLRAGKQVKTLPLDHVSHERADGFLCHHMLVVSDGVVLELEYDQDATNFVVVGNPTRQQVKRAKEATT